MDKEIDTIVNLMIAKEKIHRPKYSCLRCDFKWNTKKKDGTKPLQCPRCKSYSWNIPRKNTIANYLTDLIIKT